MRVIAGSARRLQLKTLPGKDTRPTTDRIKETLFNILQNEIGQAVFLDLFSGSGAIGIEALSRGAKKAYFVENNRKAMQIIEENLTHTNLKEKAVMMNTDAESAIRMLEGKEIFDYVYMDPPYYNDYEIQMLSALSNSSIINDETTIIIEAGLHTQLEDVEQYGFYIEREKKYKTNLHFFLKRIKIK